MGVGQLGEGGEIVAFDNEVVGCVGVVGDYRVDFIIVALDEDRKVFPKSFLDIFGFILPHEAVFLMTSYKFEQRGFLLVAQTVKGLYLSSKFCLVHGGRSVSPIPLCDG